MKKISIFCLLLSIVVLCSSFTPIAYAQDLVTNESYSECKTLDASTSLFGRSYALDNAESALLYEISTDMMLYDKNIDVPVHPSSLTKIMTAMLVLEHSALNEMVVAQQDTLDSILPGAAVANIVADEQMSVEDLLYCMMVGSANDAAAVLANYVAGSQLAFIDMMNARAEELGCTGTHFTNVHGLHAENHISTARDIAKIVNAAIENEDFIEIFGTDYYIVPPTNKSEQRPLTTLNYLMSRGDLQIYYDSRVTGGRTGVTEDEKRCVATTAERNGVKVICVILGSESVIAEDGFSVISFGSFEETSRLLDLCYNEMSATQILYSNQALKRYTVANGDCDLTVCPQVDISVILPKNTTTDDLIFRYEDVTPTLSAPIEKGQKISTVNVIYNGLTIAQGDLFAMNSVAVQEKQPAYNIPIEDGKPFSAWSLIIAIVAVIAVFLFGSRFVNLLRIKARRKRIQNRRKRSR